ncbi:ATP-dependent DNA helicase DDX11-like [Corticium candelabrum]|uniref:ATP-dependent DNA helicase DDX11-like n=1 Tax=Corticium candelabrum TaxID=121492 RepID=UPI002E267B43|nr:ATP-dependent DNA helicase DDX11-like [Corticium candelabrum]
MSELYSTLEDGKIGIFESPTGTGKSLSLICGSMTWLKDHQLRQRRQTESAVDRIKELEALVAGEVATDGVDWMEQQWEAKKELDKMMKVKEEGEMRAKGEANFKAKCKSRDSKKLGKVNAENDEDPDELLLEDYHSDDENDVTGDATEEGDDIKLTQIYYCSRTHSQLAQFVQEVKRTSFKDHFRITTLASRQNLCINPSVRRLKFVTLMNDRCIELQQKTMSEPSNKDESKRRKKTGKCPFYRSDMMQDFKYSSLTAVRDIEELSNLGEETDTCPYYGTRYSVPYAHLIVLPYQMLLHHSTRKTLGISLAGSVVIIDEAHNLLDTISAVYSAKIHGNQLVSCRDQLKRYFERYQTRLNAKNLMYVKQLLRVLSSLTRCLKPEQMSTIDSFEKGNVTAHTQSTITTVYDFIVRSKIDNINIYKLLKYCERSRIGQKLHGFIHSRLQQELSPDEILSSFPLVKNFLESLTSSDHDGRIIVTKSIALAASSLKFLLLNPSTHFSDLVRECRAIVLAGGTMQPSSEFTRQLFLPAGVQADHILEFTCGHVIPPDNLLAVGFSTGPTDVKLDFRMETRGSHSLLNELGNVLIELSRHVPAGVVVFFPSYDYERQVCDHFERTGIMESLNAEKSVFREPKIASHVDQLLCNYSHHIRHSSHGAILLAVVNGKMSEGINFADDLGRAVVMVGLPYPNRKSAELSEKMSYLDKNVARCDGRSPGDEHYENLCMKAVNQCIGRAIRHKDDYAVIVLLDHRYKRQNVCGKLPRWIASRARYDCGYETGCDVIRRFFGDRNVGNVTV